MKRWLWVALIAIIICIVIGIVTATENYTFVTKWESDINSDGKLYLPMDVAVDSSGNIYVSDSYHHQIQKFTSNGTFLTKWGTRGSGDGQFDVTFGVVVDAAGNVYVADSNNQRIQKFTPNGTFLTKWGTLGSGDGQFQGPCGLATDMSGNVYVADYSNDRIQVFTSNGAFITKWGTLGSGDGQFQGPHGLATDTSGNVYVVDNNYTIQKFTSNGTFLAKWGSPGSGDGKFENLEDVAVDSEGNVYISEYYSINFSRSNRIQKFTSNGTFLTKWGSYGINNGQFHHPWGLAIDASGNVYVVDFSNFCIQKFTSNGTFLTKWGSGITPDGKFHSPNGVAVDDTGNIYVSDYWNDRVQKFTSDGTFITKWGSYGSGDGQFWHPEDVVVDVAGNVYVADNENDRIQKFSSNGTFVARWGTSGSGDGQFFKPEGVAADASGNIYVSDNWDRIQKFGSTGTFLTKWGTFGEGDGQFNLPKDIAVDTSGNVYVADMWNHRIQKFGSTGTFLTKWGTFGEGDGQFNLPQGVAVDSGGNVYVSDSYHHRIQKFTSNGTFLTKWGSWGSDNGQLDLPEDLGVDAAGNVYVAEFNNYRIQVFARQLLSIPLANFTANVTSGPAPLTVNFSDLSSNSPTGWAWFFGDENFTAPWIGMTATAGWTARNSTSTVAIHDGSIVLMGGFDDSGNKNDVWRSPDNGTSWTQQTADAGWTARASHSSVAMPDGSIVLMGGVNTGTRYNDVWRSTDNGATWTQQTADAGWSGRLLPKSVAMPDGSIVLMGGQDSGGNKNDTWRSMDNGATWTQMTASAGWMARLSHSSVAMPDGSIVLMGGYDGTNRYNDVWRSMDNGATWTLVNLSAGWSGRNGHSTVAMPDGSIVLMGGYDSSGSYKNDVWRSTDNGSTWTLVNASAGWTGRVRHSTVAIPDGSIVLMGGSAASNINQNDVWRLMPAGSLARNPSYTYTASGIYPVALQAYNAGGYNSTLKTGYITVTGTSSPGPNTINGTIYYAGTQNATVYVHLFNQTPGPDVPAWKTKTMTYPGHPISYGFSTGNGTFWLMSYMDLNGNYTPDFNEPWGFAINKSFMQGPNMIEVTGNMTGLDITLYEPQPPNAHLIIGDIHTVASSEDSLTHGIQPVRIDRGLNIFNDNTESLVLDNATITVDGSHITNAGPMDMTIWNSTHIQWDYTSPVTIPPFNDMDAGWWNTDLVNIVDIPISVNRWVNQSIFTSPGYQLFTYNATFENTTCDWIYGRISTGYGLDNATILVDSFRTDAPIHSLHPVTAREFGFDLNMSAVQAHRPYNFSIVIFIDPTNAQGRSVEYKPGCSIAEGFSTGFRPGILNSKTATFPSDMLPSAVTNLTVASDIPLNWNYYTNNAKSVQLDVIWRHPPASNPIFQIFDFSTTYTSGDSIIHGIQTVNKNRGLGVWSENSSYQVALSNIVCTVFSLNIQNVYPENHVIWNNTLIQWSYPEPGIYDRSNSLNFYWQTNVTVPWDIPITMTRQVNRSIFAESGYQLLTLNITYENTTNTNSIYTSIDTGFNQMVMPFNATFVPRTFATDAPIQEYHPVNEHQVGFNLDMNRVVAGKPYNFSIVIFVEPKDALGQPFEYKPHVDTNMGIDTGYQEGGATTTATMPAGLLPPYVTSATLSTNASINWSYASITAVQAGLGEVFRNVSAGPYLVSGKIYYPGSETHPIYVNLYDQMPGPDIPPINSTQLFSPGRYSFPVRNGTYYLNAIIDLNDNHQWDENEPAGLAINHTMRSMVDPVVVSGTDKTDIDITLYTTPYKISGTIYYFGSATGPIGIGAFLEPHAANNASPFIGKWQESFGTYTLFVPNGTYYLRSAMDINRNFMHDAGEPAGYAINKTATDEPNAIVVNGANVTGVDIILFSHPTAWETLILPDISIPSGTRKAAPIFVANVTNASGIGFVLTYNPAILYITNITANTSLTGATLTYEINNSTGNVNVSLTTTSPITTIPPMGIVNIIVEAKGSTGQQSVLSTNFAEWTDPEFGAFALSVRQGTVRIEGIRGDFNHNGRVDIGDVTRVAYMAVGLVPYDIQADFNSNDIVDGADAAKIAWYYVGKVAIL